MRITANQVTSVRLLLLPVPIAMIYQGGTRWILGAMVVYTLLGLTDALDGMLARRYGSTPVGALLDPIVDKIFLVASYGPMIEIGWMPLPFLSWIFVRELGVTYLRTISLEEHFEFQTSKLAKLKTTVQMAGAGFALLIWLFEEPRTILAVLWIAAVLSSIPILSSILRGRKPGWRSLSGFGLITAIPVMRTFLSREQSVTGVIGVILLLTLYTGAEYVRGMRGVLWRRLRRRPMELPRILMLSCAIPFAWLPNLTQSGASVALILGVVAAELAVGGLDNSLAQSGRARGPWPDLLRSTIQAGAGLTLGWLLLQGADPLFLWGVGWLALFATLSDFVVRLFRNYDTFVESV